MDVRDKTERGENVGPPVSVRSAWRIVASATSIGCRARVKAIAADGDTTLASEEDNAANPCSPQCGHAGL
jgi:hypothetical protein